MSTVNAWLDARYMGACCITQVVDPWGDVIAKAAGEEEIVYSTIDLSRQETVRQQVPVQYQKREDVYRKLDKQ